MTCAKCQVNIDRTAEALLKVIHERDTLVCDKRALVGRISVQNQEDEQKDKKTQAVLPEEFRYKASDNTVLKDHTNGEEKMTRNEKKKKLAQSAIGLALAIEGGGDAFFGNQGVSLYPNGETGDVLGKIAQRAGLVPKLNYEISDPKEAVALALGIPVNNLSQKVQETINELAYVSDYTKRAYARRVPKLAKLLRRFAAEMLVTHSVAPVSRSTATKFTARGASI